MPTEEPSPTDYAQVFASFIRMVAAQAHSDQGTLSRRIADHLGLDPVNLPVVSQDFETMTTQPAGGAGRLVVLEPALAARPGRIDLAVELPLPDAAGRRRLFDLYARGLNLDQVDVDAIVAATEGAAPAYLNELLRKAAVIALERGAGVRVAQPDIEGAMAELSAGGELADRISGRRPSPAEPSSQGFVRGMSSGFPTISRFVGSPDG